MESFFLYKASRYDIKGKEYIASKPDGNKENNLG